ncbi:MAG: hypothetical protein FK733_01470 [Asgard group archaeon]|nr:hypothetical protein [Asgard group archaeon]
MKTASLASINDLETVIIRPSTDDILGKVSSFRDGIVIEGNSLIADSENNSFITGTIDLDFGFSFDYFIGKLNSTGDMVWYETKSIQSIDKSNDIAISSNQQNGYIVGETTNNTDDLSECFISCFDLSNGTELWNTTINKSLYSLSGYSLAIYNESIYVAGLEKVDFHTYSVTYVFLACINATDHSLQWLNTCSTGIIDSHPMLELNTQQDELVLVYNKLDNQNYQYAIQTYDLNGNNTGSFLTNLSSKPIVNDFVLFNSDGLLLTGHCYESGETPHRDIYIAKFNLSSETLDEYVIGNQYQNEFAHGIIFYDSENILIGGYLESPLTDREAAFLATIQLDGTLNWFRASSNFHLSTIKDMVTLANNHTVIIGSAQYNYDFFYKRLLYSITSDNDRDSLSDYWEPIIGTDPNKFDTDGDGYSDAEELFASTDPLDPKSYPGRRRSLVNFGLSIFIIITVSFIGFQLYITIKQRRQAPEDKKTITQKFIEFVKQKTRKKE